MRDTLSNAPMWVRIVAAIVRRLPLGRYRVVDRLRGSGAGEFVTTMSRQLGSSRFVCDLRDAIAREVCFTGRYAPQETDLVRALLGPGMTFVDVGANWGYFTLVGAKLVGPSGQVLSLEPDPRLRAALDENIARNGIDTVRVRQVAAADRDGTLILAGYDEAQGNFGVSRLVDEWPSGDHRYEVRVRPLDAILEEEKIERVDLMKIDIEGAELLAIEGAKSLLRDRRIARLMLELHPVELAEQGASVEALVALLIGAGYEGFTIDHDPDVTRAWAYGRIDGLGGVVRPLVVGQPLDRWPHQLWCAPGQIPDWAPRATPRATVERV